MRIKRRILQKIVDCAGGQGIREHPNTAPDNGLLRSPRRPRDADLRLRYDGRNRRERGAQTGLNGAVHRRCTVSESPRGEPLEAVELAAWIGEVVEPEACGQLQVAGNPDVVRYIKAQLIEINPLFGACRESLEDSVPCARSAAGCEVGERKGHHLWVVKKKFPSVMSSLWKLSPSLKVVPSVNPAESSTN